ncbi:uncharacterized protein BXZ73DRAFT_102900 [Epithele typhae]|uniref:uncharacterized protein n=1 Tax=Epithele typhae TaxID=378194 RepID=UPI0020085025|nr:uncharacterized protein BXZ73DRAFT_102900 [Epithele typhae]KAH9926644.1 hypothetical protein BXZ73DRAFT_102900 [Epithele typhae]
MVCPSLRFIAPCRSRPTHPKVIVNDKKFACEACIKGHRSSGCKHTERPLYEVKKKGRPISQCDHCRELRKTKRKHDKCNCVSATHPPPSNPPLAPAPTGSKPKVPRFKPIAPALPNGLRDILPKPSNSKHGCRCKVDDASGCTCGDKTGPSKAAPPNSSSGLDALAQAAMFCEGESRLPENPPASTEIEHPETVTDEDPAPRKRCCSGSGSGSASSRPPSPKPKRPRGTSVYELLSPPYGGPAATARSSIDVPPPAFPPVAAYRPVTSTSDACCCGMQCACPGCEVHRGTEHASKDHKDCTAGECATCVDNDAGAGALPARTLAYSQGNATAPPSAPGSSVGASAYIDAFFAAAAALPAPPPGRRGLLALDPTDVRVYPREVLAAGAETRSLFGLVDFSFSCSANLDVGSARLLWASA